jgi:NADPH-dependent curcumin reductase CurA
MIDPLSITAGAILAYALPKLLDASLEKVGEMLTEEAMNQARQKGQALRQAILRRLNPEKQRQLEQAMAAAETSPDERQKLEGWLERMMQQHPDFAEELRKLAQEIHQIINVDTGQARNVQQIFAGGQGLMAPDANAPVIQAGAGSQFTFNYTTAPPAQ